MQLLCTPISALEVASDAFASYTIAASGARIDVAARDIVLTVPTRELLELPPAEPPRFDGRIDYLGERAVRAIERLASDAVGDGFSLHAAMREMRVV